MSKDKEVKVQFDTRQDGRFSVTVKLIAWTTNELRGFLMALYHHPMGRNAAEQIAAGMAEIAREHASGDSPEPVEGDTTDTGGTGPGDAEGTTSATRPKSAKVKGKQTKG